MPIKLFEADHRIKTMENEIYPRPPVYISWTQLIMVSPIIPGIIPSIMRISAVSVSGVYLISVDVRIIIGKMDKNKKNADCAEYAGRLSEANFDNMRPGQDCFHHSASI